MVSLASPEKETRLDLKHPVLQHTVSKITT